MRDFYLTNSLIYKVNTLIVILKIDLQENTQVEVNKDWT